MTLTGSGDFDLPKGLAGAEWSILLAGCCRVCWRGDEGSGLRLVGAKAPPSLRIMRCSEALEVRSALSMAVTRLGGDVSEKGGE